MYVFTVLYSSNSQYFNKIISCLYDGLQLRKRNMETCLKVVKKSFDKLSAFTIHESYDRY